MAFYIVAGDKYCDMRSGPQYIMAPNNMMYNVTVARSQCKSLLRFGQPEVVGYNYTDSVEYVRMTVLTPSEIDTYRAFLPDVMDVSMEYCCII